MEKKITKPPIRFTEFSGDWEKRKLATLFDKFDDGDWIEAEDQSSKGIRLIQTGNVGVTEFIDKPDNKKWISEDTFNRLHCEEIFPGDILISRLPEPAGRACIVPETGTRMITAVDCTIARTSDYNSADFIVQYLATPGYFKWVNTCLAGGTRQRISRRVLSDCDVMVPPTTKEQLEIGNFLKALDTLIATHQQEISRLGHLREAMVDEMFPAQGENVPKVRFEEFTKPWRLEKFSNIFTERHTIDTISEEYPQLAFTIDEGVIWPEDKKTNKRDFLILDKENKKYLQTEYDDIIYNPANVVFGAIHRNSLGKGCVSPIYKIFETNQDASFMECIVRHPRFIKEISRNLEGTVKKLRTLKPKAFLNMSAYIAPTEEEQKKIGQYFTLMDELINTEKEELEKVKHIKQACLGKMFV